MTQALVLPSTVKNLIVARESDPGSHGRGGLLEGMIHQTLLQFRDQLDLGEYNPDFVARDEALTAFDRLMVLGSEPLDADPEDELFNVTRWREQRTRGCEFRLGDNVFLYALGSASKSDDEDDNAFVAHLCERIKTLTPTCVLTATFSRLCRSTNHSSELLRALKKRATSPHHIAEAAERRERPSATLLSVGSGTVLNVANEGDEMQYTLLGLVSSWERRSIVTRTMIGKLNAVRRGHWHTRITALPLGYVINAEGRLAANPDMQPHVAKVIDMLGDPRMTPSHLLTNLAAIGITTPSDARGWGFDPQWAPLGAYEDRVIRESISARNAIAAEGPDAPGSQATSDEGFRLHDSLDEPVLTTAGLPNAHALRKRLYEYLDLWEHGRYVVAVDNPVAEASHYADAVVVPREGKPYGVVELVYERPELKVEGKWASAEAFGRARERLAQLQLERRSGGGSRYPLVGSVSRWTEDGVQYRLATQSRTSGHRRSARYILEGRSAAHGSEGWPNDASNELFAVRIHDLHRELVQAAVQAFRDGVHIEPVETALERQQADEWRRETERLQTSLQTVCAEQVDRLDRRDRARDEGRSLDEEVHEYALQAASQRRRALEEELANRASAPVRTTLANRIDLQAETLVQALSVIEGADAPLPPVAAQAVSAVLQDFRLKSLSTLEAEFSYFLHMPLDDGALRVGPIVGKCRQADAPRRTDYGDRRGGDVAELLLRSDALDDGRQAFSAADITRAEEYLQSKGLTRPSARSVLAAVPVDLRRLVWDLLHDAERSVDLDPAFVARVRNTYLGPSAKPKQQGAVWYRKTLMPASIMQLLVERGQMPTTEFLAWLTRTGFSANGYHRHVRSTEQASADKERHFVATTVPIGYVGGPLPQSVALFDCRHCGEESSLSIYAPVFDVPLSLLCGSCLRTREAESPRYPESYGLVSRANAERRLLTLHTGSRRNAGLIDPSPELRARVQGWHRAIDPDAQRVAVTDRHLQTYLCAVASGTVEDDRAVRDWVREMHDAQGGTRGQLGYESFKAFARVFLAVDPRPVREWLDESRRRLPAPGPKRVETLDEFIEVVWARRGM